MKVLIVVLVAAVCYVHADFTPEELAKKEKIAAECKAETGAPDEDIAALKIHMFPKTHEGKCFLACLKKKIGIIDADNKFNLDRVKELLEKLKEKAGDKYEPMVKIAETCAAEVPGGPDVCEVAAKHMVCVIREFKSHNINIDDFKLH